MAIRLFSLCRLPRTCLCSTNNSSIGSIVRLSNARRSLRMYSQAQTSQKGNVISKLTVKKKRPRRKGNQQPSIEKSGFWNVVAVATAEEYDLESMYKSLITDGNYRISDFFESIYSQDKNFEFLHAVARSETENESRELFIFQEGSFVAWNVSNAEINDILNFVRNYEVNGYDETMIKDEIEVMPYTYSLNNNKISLLHNGNICLTQKHEKWSLDKYSCSNGMVASVKLGIWETLLDKFIETIEPVTADLKNGNRITLSRKELLKWTGELYDLKHKINLSSNLLDTPDFYWEREELERFYLSTCRYFNLPKRTKVINDKIHHCIELVDLLSSHLSDRHHIRLEWMIIALIMVEVAFEVVHYIRD